ncbi:MAG: DUF805 domain-containing protein [Gallionella sp.]|nr:DUF805 domain-containing protein [Gallionella sp.]
MTFGESISTCFSKYADFNGRASRSEYWWWFLFTVLGYIATMMISELVYGLFALAVFLPSIAVAARRLHDTNRSGWLQLIVLIPLAGLIVIYWLAQETRLSDRDGEIDGKS